MFSRLKGSIFILVLFIIAISACQNNSSSKKEAVGAEKTETDLKEVTDKMKKDGSTNNQEVMTYKVSLGVMPDMNYEGEGVLIGHVNDGKPGFRAGLLKGDVVLEMDGEKIIDLVSYTKVLGRFEKGDQTKVVVKRGDDTITALVEF